MLQAALPNIAAIAPYQPGKPIDELAREYGLNPADIIKLASNENPMGMPAQARLAAAQAFDSGARYPDANGFALKSALAQRLAVPANWITLGNGSNDLLELAAAVSLAPGRSAVIAQYAFLVYALAIQARGAHALVTEAKNFGHDLEAMLAAVRADTRLLFIANPNNPTGSFLPAAQLEAFLARVPEHVIVVLDEAYNEYLAPELRSDSVAWVRRWPNLLVTRTFSKAYGLAGLRVGYGIAQPELTDLLNRARQPFNVNAVAQAAALAALEDHAFLERAQQLNATGKQLLASAFDQWGLRHLPSQGNFILLEVGDAAHVYEGLLREGVIVRPVHNYGLPQWLRITIGLPAENEKFLAALRRVLQSTAERT